MSEEYASGTYCMEMLKATNWLPWKHQMLVVLRDLRLEKYIAKDAAPPKSVNLTRPTTEEKEAIAKWESGDAKAQTRIELAISDSEMVHISRANTAREMWEQLSMVKEAKGRLGILSTCRALFRMTADEGSRFNMVKHVSKLQNLQEEFHLMDSKVTDKDFVMILITSLPDVKGVTSRDIALELQSKSRDIWTWPQLMCCALISCALLQSLSYISEVLLKMSGVMEELQSYDEEQRAGLETETEDRG
jgi:hypothetical protein